MSNSSKMMIATGTDTRVPVNMILANTRLSICNSMKPEMVTMVAETISGGMLNPTDANETAVRAAGFESRMPLHFASRCIRGLARIAYVLAMPQYTSPAMVYTMIAKMWLAKKNESIEITMTRKVVAGKTDIDVKNKFSNAILNDSSLFT